MAGRGGKQRTCSFKGAKTEFLGITQRFLQNPVNLDMVDGCEKDLHTRQVGDTNRHGQKKKTANPQVVVFFGKIGI